jgi:hypothetical protein
MASFRTLLTAVFLVLPVVVHAQYNDAQCEASSQNFTWGYQGTLDTNGNPLTSNSGYVAGITYDFCLDHCGHGSDLNSWSDFETQLGLWLLPWITLLSQLPYLSKNKLEDLFVFVLTIGSPTTAFYSLFVTIHNRKWLRDRINGLKDELKREDVDRLKAIANVLGSLHQFPVGIKDMGYFALTISDKMPEHNKDWWRQLSEWFKVRKMRMRLSAWAQLGFAMVVYIFAVAEAFLQLGGITCNALI